MAQVEGRTARHWHTLLTDSYVVWDPATGTSVYKIALWTFNAMWRTGRLVKVGQGRDVHGVEYTDYIWKE